MAAQDDPTVEQSINWISGQEQQEDWGLATIHVWAITV